MPDDKVIVLKVAADTRIPGLAGAMVKNLDEGKTVYARAYGSQALYQMTKAVAMANVYMDGQDEIWALIDTRFLEALNQDSIREFTFLLQKRSALRATA